MESVLNQTIKNLKINKFKVLYAENEEEAKDQIYSLMEKGASVGFGGSVTLEEIGILDELRENADYKLLDKTKAKNKDEASKIMHASLDADFYLTSANGVTQDGKLINIDYRGNRNAATTYGPSKVIFVVGVNKISEDIEAAYARVKDVVVKRNAKRLDWETPCIDQDHCIDCKSEKRMCGVVTIHEFQTIPDKINIIMVNKVLGY